MPDLPITNIEIPALARELLAAYVSGGTIAVPLSARDENFDMNAAYSIEAEFVRLRIESGRTTTGLKVGYANKAMCALKAQNPGLGPICTTTRFTNGFAQLYFMITADSVRGSTVQEKYAINRKDRDTLQRRPI